MKKRMILLFILAFSIIFTACSQQDNNEKTAANTIETAEECINALKDAGLPIGQIIVYDETTDPNGILGRPGRYTSKADFEDTTVEQYDDAIIEQIGETVIGGTVEMFETAEDCQDRYDYLMQFDDPSLGPMGLDAYMYKSDLAILRVDYDVLPDDAKKYEETFYTLFSVK